MTEGSEVFRKEKLERKTTMEEKRGKQKRRDSRVSKTKTSKVCIVLFVLYCLFTTYNCGHLLLFRGQEAVEEEETFWLR